MRRRTFVTALGALLLAFGAVDAAAQTKTVIVVRHAEKADDSADPVLSEAGQQRARELSAALDGRAIGAIFTTQYQRTRLTAAPTAERLGLPVSVVEARGANHPADVAARVRASDAATVLVVGHSNTVPAIVRALGAGDVGTIEDPEYGHMFVVTLNGETATVERSWYGAPAQAAK